MKMRLFPCVVFFLAGVAVGFVVNGNGLAGMFLWGASFALAMIDLSTHEVL